MRCTAKKSCQTESSWLGNSFLASLSPLDNKHHVQSQRAWFSTPPCYSAAFTCQISHGSQRDCSVRLDVRDGASEGLDLGFHTMLQVVHTTNISCICFSPLLLSLCIATVTHPCLSRCYTENSHLFSGHVEKRKVEKGCSKIQSNLLGHLQF